MDSQNHGGGFQVTYFLIYTNADGEVSVTHASREELEASLADGTLDAKQMKELPGADLMDDDIAAQEGWYLIEGKPVALQKRKARIEREVFELPK
jgi:hypothetical protein